LGLGRVAAGLPDLKIKLLGAMAFGHYEGLPRGGSLYELKK